MLTKQTNSGLGKENKYERYDLCTTCNYSEDCRHRKKNGVLVIYCEEFDDYVPLQNEIPINYETKKTRELKTKRPKGKKYLGLCQNCDTLETCTYKKPEGGVWHCEDYQ